MLGSVVVETIVLYMSTRQNPAQAINEAAAAYKVDTETIALKVKREFAAKAKAQAAKKGVAKVQPKALKKAKAA